MKVLCEGQRLFQGRHTPSVIPVVEAVDRNARILAELIARKIILCQKFAESPGKSRRGTKIRVLGIGRTPQKIVHGKPECVGDFDDIGEFRHAFAPQIAIRLGKIDLALLRKLLHAQLIVIEQFQQRIAEISLHLILYDSRPNNSSSEQ